MSKLPAFRELQNFISEQTAPKSYKKPKSKVETANHLTRQIVDHLRESGHFATRLQSTGTYRTDAKKYVPSQQRAGMPDVLAIVNGHAVFVEVKTGTDRLSVVQKQTIADLNASKAMVFVAHDFQGFYDWFSELVLATPKLPTSLDHKRHPIPRLATPDLS